MLDSLFLFESFHEITETVCSFASRSSVGCSRAARGHGHQIDSITESCTLPACSAVVCMLQKGTGPALRAAADVLAA